MSYTNRKFTWDFDALKRYNRKYSQVYDVTAYNDGATFDSLEDLLSSESLDTLIPADYRKGGMTIQFVLTSDNKYVQFRYMLEYENTRIGNAKFIEEINWQGVDEEPTGASHNLVESGGVKLSTDVEVVSSLFGAVNNLGISGMTVANGVEVVATVPTSNAFGLLIYLPSGITKLKVDNCSPLKSSYIFINKPKVGDPAGEVATKTVDGTTATITVNSNPNGLWLLMNVDKRDGEIDAVTIRSSYQEMEADVTTLKSDVQTISTTLSPLSAKVTSLETDVDGLKDVVEPLTIESCNAYITNTGLWATGHATIYGALIPVKSGDVVTINSSISTKYYSVLKDNVIVGGETPNYATGYSGRVSGMPDNVTMPSDAKYLWFDISWGEEVLPTNIIINGVDRLKSLSDIVMDCAEDIAVLQGDVNNINEDIDRIETELSLYSNLGCQAFVYKSADEFIVASKFNGDSNYDLVIHFGMCLQNSLHTIFSFKRVSKVPNTSLLPNADVAYDAGDVIFTQTSDCIIATRFNRYSDYHGTSDADRAYSSGFHALNYNETYYKTGETKSKTIVADGVSLSVGDSGFADEIIINAITDAYDPFILYDSLVTDAANPIYSTIFVEDMIYKVYNGCIDCTVTRKFTKTCYMETFGGFASMANTLQYGYFPNGEAMESPQTDKFGELTYNVGTSQGQSGHNALKEDYPEFSHFIRRNANGSIFESIFMSDYGAGDHSEIPNDYAIYWVYNATGLTWKKVYHRVTYEKTFNNGDRQKMNCIFNWFKTEANADNYIVYNAGNLLFVDVKGAYSGVVPVPSIFAGKAYTFVEQTSGITSVGDVIDADGLEITATGEGSVILKVNL